MRILLFGETVADAAVNAGAEGEMLARFGASMRGARIAAARCRFPPLLPPPLDGRSEP
ncbi:hypothetical protein ACFIOY_16130 [Bradyrhizobium sp. TZ2]